mgnify:CR=1 FL=1
MNDFEQRFPYKGKTSCLHTDVVVWLETYIGKFDHEWYRYGADIAMDMNEGAPLYDYYRFRTERSAIMFSLRWS